MSDKLVPWIHDYLIDISQRLGARYFSAEPATKPKKVQLLAFRGYRPRDVDDNSHIWVDVSDKAFTIPVVFTIKAVESYKQRHPIDQCEKAVLSIKSFRPIFRRVPLRGTTGLTDKEELALQCDAFSIADTSLKDTLGQPAELHTSPDLNDWIHGLRRGGSGGTSFMAKKTSQKQRKPQQNGLVSPPKDRLNKMSEPKVAGGLKVMSEHQDVANAIREYDHWWSRHLDKSNQPEYLRKATVDADAWQNDSNSRPADERQDDSDSEASTTSRPLTDSWSPSPRNSRTTPVNPMQESKAQLSAPETLAPARCPKVSSEATPILTERPRKIPDSLDFGGSEPGDMSPHLSLPTRRQRPRKTIASEIIRGSKNRTDVTDDRSHIYLPSSPSRRPVSRKSVAQSATSSKKHSTTFPGIQPQDLPSSFTLGQDGFLSSSPLGPLPSVGRPLAADKLRKVPPPAQLNRFPINSQSTPKILAPDSDTSSQPFSQSQLQSQSWLYSQSQGCPPTQYHELFSQSQPQLQSQSKLHSQLPQHPQPNVSDQFSGQAAEDEPPFEPSLRLPQPFSQPFSPSGASQQVVVTSTANLPERDTEDIDDHDSLFSADDYDGDLSHNGSQSSVLRENTENASLSVNPPNTQRDMDVDGSSDETSDSDSDSDSEFDKQSSAKRSHGRRHNGSDTEDRNAGRNRPLDPDDFETETDLFSHSQRSHSQIAARSRRKRKQVLLGVDDLEETRASISRTRASIIRHSPSAWAAPSFMRQTVVRGSAEPSGSQSRYARPDGTTSQQDKTVLGAPQRGNPHTSRSTTSNIGETADEIMSTRKKDTVTTMRRTLSRKDADNQIMEGSVGMKRTSDDNQHHRLLKRGKGNASQSISRSGSGSTHTRTKLLGFSIALDKKGLQNDYGDELDFVLHDCCCFERYSAVGQLTDLAPATMLSLLSMEERNSEEITIMIVKNMDSRVIETAHRGLCDSRTGKSDEHKCVFATSHIFFSPFWPPPDQRRYGVSRLLLFFYIVVVVAVVTRVLDTVAYVSNAFSHLRVAARGPPTILSVQHYPESPLATTTGSAGLISKSRRKDSFFLVMSISFGSLGLISLRNPLADAMGILWGKGDIRSMFWLIVFCIFFLILAYLTNPSETSFRTFLTEQSFRQHLSRLDDSIDDDHDSHETKCSVRRGVNSTAHTLPFDNRSPFHFANCASVSLRTPKHVFHTFGIFTIAVIVPISKSDRDPVDRRSDSMVSVISDSWYLGAFGKWWRGGMLDEWYHDVIARNDEESWSSGILGMKTSERHHEYNGGQCDLSLSLLLVSEVITALPGLPFTTKNLPPHLLSRGSPPRLRNRDKSSQRSGLLPTRSSTPPPLPKSVSLPLHATRSSQALTDHSVITQHPSQSLSSFPVDPVNTGAQLPSASSPLTVFDQSPHVVELLRQVNSSTASILDLRNQLNDCKTSASQSHATLQRELESCRERKRQEDSMRAELKSRTKALDDSKRQAESMKRDSDKRLKAALAARNHTEQRIAYLDSEVLRLRGCLVDDEASVRHSKDAESSAEQTIKGSLEQKRTEIKVADDVVTALNIRARELEKRLTTQKERLQSLRERSQSQQLTRSLHHGFHVIDPASSSWSLKDSSYDITHSPTISSQDDSLRDERVSGQSPQPSESIIGNPSDHVSASAPIPLRSKTYAMLEDGFSSLAVQTSQPAVGNFAPFADLDPHPSQSSMAVSPTSSSLIPSGLMSSLALDNTDGISRSFQSENDVFLDRHWRNNGVHGHPQRLNTDESSPKYGTMTASSPTSLHDVSTGDTDYDPFEVRMLTPRERERYSLRSESAMDMQRALFHRNSSTSSLVHPTSEEFDPAPGADKPSAPRRWFFKDKAIKGLNPDAKVFSISGASDSQKQGHFSQMSFDALNPHGLGPNVMTAPTSDSSTLLRAFAPSPAEREVLQRAFGGSTNTSLERLPNLSDVGSIPPSPSHVNAHALTVPVHDRIPSWLQSLPRIRKPKFSPWDDEELSVNKKVATSGERGH
ncbi:hypothetical protein DFS33DRAFT_1377389 [Desarmillaria ectypa]|nr:hypothetical protein DFS33DRAFT_1377389 [Desarmillaria ectypa]